MEGEWGRKVSTPMQFAVALSTKCVNTTVLLVKPKHDCPFMAAKFPPIKAISTYLAAHYDHHSKTPQVSFFHNLGQSVPSYITKLIPALFDSHDQVKSRSQMLVVVEYNFTIWILRTMPLRKSKRQHSKEKPESIKAEVMKDVCSIYPQCTCCQCHFKSALGRERHKCKGPHHAM